MSEFARDQFLAAAGVNAALVVALVLATWVVGRAIGRYNVIDVTWGLGFAAVALTTFVTSAGDGDAATRGLVLALTAVWGIRLAVYIGLRSRGRGEDPRYAAMLDGRRSRARAALLSISLPQAAAMWFISLPDQVAMFEASGSDHPLVIAGVAVWLVGFAFESVGDWQLARFRADPANHDQVMDRGLWRFTRHPNYFGDASMWWGLYLIAASQWEGAVTVLSPVVMTYLLARKTGKPLLERDIASRRPGYEAYVRRTSGFVPWFPRPPGRSAS